jgi:hypothetical protein
MAEGRGGFASTVLGWLALLLGGSLTAWVGWNNTFWAFLGMAFMLTATLGFLSSLFTAFRRRRQGASDGAPQSVSRQPLTPPPATPVATLPARPPVPPTPPAPSEAPIALRPAVSSPTPPESAAVAFDRPVFEARVPRDYDQRVRVPLRNNTSRAITVAARATRAFDELPADVVGPGSVDEPVELAPGAALTLELAITAPDATRDSYEIPIEAGGASTVVRVTVDRPELKLSFRITERNPITLAATFDITNDGETVGDLALALTGEEDNIARLEPTASHAYLPSGKTLTLTATPVLYLEFERAVANVECRAAGQLRSFPIEFTAPTGRRLMGIRTACGHHSHSFDWICTNRPNIVLTLFGPDCPGEYYDEVLEMIRDAISAAGLDPFIDAYRVVSPIIHTGLDFAGMVEGPIGVAADAANTVLYAAEGDWTSAGLSATAMIPLIGTGATLSKYGIRLTREAAQRLGKEGLEQVFRRAKAATRASGDAHHVRPPHRPKSAASGASGAGASRAAGGGPPTPPRGGGSPGGGGPDGPSGPPSGGRPPGDPPGGRPPGGRPPGGRPPGGDPPDPGRAWKSSDDAPGQINRDCMIASREYAKRKALPDTPEVNHSGPGVFNPLGDYRDRLRVPVDHGAVRNPDGSIYDATLVHNIESTVRNIPGGAPAWLPAELDRWRRVDTFEPSTYAELMEMWVDLINQTFTRVHPR